MSATNVEAEENATNTDVLGNILGGFLFDLEAYARLTDPASANSQMKNDYMNAYTTISMVSALLAGFALSLLCSPIEIEDDVTGGIPKDDTLWGDDSWHTGRDIYYFLVSLTVVLSIFEVLVSMQMVLQLSQCPTSIVKSYMMKASDAHHFPFKILVFSVVGFVASGIFLVSDGMLIYVSRFVLSFESSLICKTAYFITVLIITVLFIPFLLMHMFKPLFIRRDLMREALRDSLGISLTHSLRLGNAKK